MVPALGRLRQEDLSKRESTQVGPPNHAQQASADQSGLGLALRSTQHKMNENTRERGARQLGASAALAENHTSWPPTNCTSNSRVLDTFGL